MLEEKSTESSLKDTKKKSFLGVFSKYKKVFRIIVSLVIASLLFLLIYPSLQRYYYSMRDRYVIPEPEWESYDTEDGQNGFALVKLTKMIEDSGVDSTTFFLNKFSVFGSDSSEEECAGTQYKCGDGEWIDFDDSYTALSNHCIVKVKAESYCNVILPGGTLIMAVNYQKKSDLIRNSFSDASMMFQVNIEDDNITVVQSVTYQESALWNIVSSASGKKYFVKVGDQVIQSTGTRFATISRDSTGTTSTAVTEGNIKVNTNTSTTEVAIGEYLTGNSFNTTQCPSTLKACGSNCIPKNGVCCDEATSSYCLSPLSCTSNETGKCSSKIFFGNSSNYCCSNSDLADDFSMFHRGSYDCKEGFKFCGMSCIPEAQTCCYPTDNNCPVEEIAVTKEGIPEGTHFPREYVMNIYAELISDSTFKNYVLDAGFPFNEEIFQNAMEYIVAEFKTNVVADYAESDREEEQETYCKTFTPSSLCDISSTSSSSDNGASSDSSSDIACSEYITEIYECLPKGIIGGMYCDSGMRQCSGIFPGGGLGDGCIPERCVK